MLTIKEMMFTIRTYFNMLCNNSICHEYIYSYINIVMVHAHVLLSLFYLYAHLHEARVPPFTSNVTQLPLPQDISTVLHRNPTQQQKHLDQQ